MPAEGRILVARDWEFEFVSASPRHGYELPATDYVRGVTLAFAPRKIDARHDGHDRAARRAARSPLAWANRSLPPPSAWSCSAAGSVRAVNPKCRPCARAAID